MSESNPDPAFPLVSSERTDGKGAGEFSGVGGIVQPPPHLPDRSEQLQIDNHTFMHPAPVE
jgi:hypothetical protein